MSIWVENLTANLRANTRRLTIVGVVLMAAVGLPASNVFGAANACSALFSTNSISPGEQSRTYLQVNNDGTNAINWIKVTRSTADYTIVGASSVDWTANATSSYVVYTGSTLTAGAAYNKLLIQIQAGSNEGASSSWSVQVSGDPGGSNPFSCDDAGLDMSVNDGIGPGVSDVTVANLSSKSATVTWSTDEPATSKLNYGRNNQYGTSSSISNALVTSHSVTISGLTPATGYHFQVVSADGAGNETTSGDNTFLTGVVGFDVVVGTKTLPPTTKVPIILSPSAEKQPPTVSVTSSIAKILKAAPVVQGVADDNVAIAEIQYSTDGGKNWLPVDNSTGLGTKHAVFSFTPLLPQDDNYELIVQAIDTSGNTGNTQAVSLVIDRLPPLVGGNLVSVGPQIIQPSKDGTLLALAGVDQKITLSAVGGPIRITIQATIAATQKGKKPYSENFTLTQSEDTGLWSGVAGFTRSGTYNLVANAIDGAGNKTTRDLNAVYVSPPGRTLDDSTQKAVSASVTAYYLEPETQSWTVWDAAAFGQTNPQRTNSKGAFNMLLPAGTYYLQVKAAGYHTFVSSIFTVKQATPFTSSLQLRPMRGLHVGSHYLSWPNFGVQHVTPGSGQAKVATVTAKNQSDLINKPAPDFSLMDTTGAVVRTADLLGRPTVISINSIWSPTTAEQLAVLSGLQANREINVVPIALQDNLSRVQTYTAISDVKLRWLVDPESKLSDSYKVHSLPTQYFLDRKGIIRHVVVGTLSKQQMLNLLTEF